MQDKRGWWYWLSLTNTALLFLALRGLFGQEAKEESEVALGDLGYAIFKLRHVLIVLALIVVGAMVILLCEQTR
jgi:hypothetical protein